MSYVEESTVIDETIYDLINEAFDNEREYKDAKYRNSIFTEHNEYFVKTDDGSYSIKSKEINHKVETLHTSTGAISESFEKFIKPLKLNYDEDIAILDICAGLGYNSSAAIDDFLKNSDGSTNLHIDMLEISKPTLAAGLMVPSPIEAHDITKRAIEQSLIDCDYASLELEETVIPSNIDLKIHIDDARQVIQKLEDNTYDAIFLDPFSQNMSPELVSLEFFKEFRRVIKDNGIVCTYTSSSPVRMAFIKMALSDVGIPFRDPNLNLSSQEILDNRTEERHNARHNTKISSAVKTPIFLGQVMDDEPLKRRVERNLAKMNIPGVLSNEAFYIVEPENDYKEEYLEDNNTRTRVLEMMKRLAEIKNKRNMPIKQYADELSKRTGIETVEYTEITDINQYDTIVYLAPLYAGSVMGLKKTLNKIRNVQDKKLIVGTVGLADPNDKRNREGIMNGIKEQVHGCIYNKARVYFLRGAIDYSHLNLKHKTMMAFIHRKVKGMKEEEMTAEIKAVIETYGKNVSYIDFDALNPIMDEIQ